MAVVATMKVTEQRVLDSDPGYITCVLTPTSAVYTPLAKGVLSLRVIAPATGYDVGTELDLDLS